MVKLNSESYQQIQFVNWFHRHFSDFIICSIPNGGDRPGAAAKQMKLEGAYKGMPDLHIPDMGLYIEMKRPRGGVVSNEQKRVMHQLENGRFFQYKTAACPTKLEAIKVVLDRYQELTGEPIPRDRYQQLCDDQPKLLMRG